MKTRHLLEKIAGELVGEYAKHASQAWKELVNRFLIENARVEPMVNMIADENWMTFTLRYVVDYKKRRTTKDILFFTTSQLSKRFSVFPMTLANSDRKY